MKTEQFKFEVTITVQVDAFSEGDAKELVEDVFGPGSDCGVEVVDFNIK